MSKAYSGLEQKHSSTGRYKEMSFVIRQILAEIGTSLPVKVVAVTNTGAVAPVGLVDVQPLVHQLDGQGNAVPHGIIHNVPYFRLQGGANAIIIDPVVGDIGLALFASHDISSVKANKAASNPGSRRRFSMADAIYLGGILNAAPAQYIQFDSNGDVTIKPASTVTILGDLHVTQTVTADTDVIGGGKSLKDHTHGGVQPGGGTSGPPS